MRGVCIHSGGIQNLACVNAHTHKHARTRTHTHTRRRYAKSCMHKRTRANTHTHEHTHTFGFVSKRHDTCRGISPCLICVCVCVYVCVRARVRACVRACRGVRLLDLPSGERESACVGARRRKKGE
jgi:hypothetical protein